MKKYHHCVKFTYPLSFQTRIPKVDQHTGGKWLIHGTKHRKDNQLQSLELSSNNVRFGASLCITKYNEPQNEKLRSFYKFMRSSECLCNLSVVYALYVILSTISLNATAVTEWGYLVNE